MRLVFLEPGDRDVTGAPAADRHVNNLLGKDSYDGSAAAPGAAGVGPKKTLAAMPGAPGVGYTLAARRGRRQFVRQDAVQTVPDSVAWTAVSAGNIGSPAELITWGTGEEPMFAGDVLVQNATGNLWGDVVEDYGNSYLAANGEELLAPDWASYWHGHYIGQDMLTPAFWCPNSPGSNPSWLGTGSANPGTLDDMCRWDYGPNFEGSEGIFVSTSIYTQASVAAIGGGDWALTDFDVTKLFRYQVRNASGVVGISTQGTDGETILEIEHPAIAAHYGANSPVGSWVRWLGKGNANRYALIVAYDQGSSTLTATTGIYNIPSGGPHCPRVDDDKSAWAIVGNPYDIVQEGQWGIRPTSLAGGTTAAQYASAEASDKTVSRVRGSWMTGSSTISNWTSVFKVSGTYFNMSDVRFGRQAGLHTLSGGNYALNPAGLAGGTWDNIGFLQAMSADEDSFVFGSSACSDMTITNMYTQEGFQCGGWRVNIGASVIDGYLAYELGRTGILLRSDGGVARTIVRNMEMPGNRSVHGNCDSTYAVSRLVTIEKSINADSNQGSTSQVDPSVTTPRDIRHLNSMYSAPRSISTSYGAAMDGTYGIQSDDGFESCLWKHLFLPTAGTIGIRVGGTGAGTGGNQNDNGVLDRCYTAGLISIGTASAGGSPVLIQDCLSTSNYGGSGTPAAWVADGNTVSRAAYDPAEISLGGFSLAAWEYFTRADGFNPGAPTYASVQVGSDRVGWVLPAYVSADPPGNCGAAEDLMLSTTFYRRGHQAGRPLGVILKMRPGTNSNTANATGAFWVDPVFGVGATLLNDRGYLVRTVRTTEAEITFKLWEKTIGGETHSTIITLEGRR